MMAHHTKFYNSVKFAGCQIAVACKMTTMADVPSPATVLESLRTCWESLLRAIARQLSKKTNRRGVWRVLRCFWSHQSICSQWRIFFLDESYCKRIYSPSPTQYQKIDFCPLVKIRPDSGVEGFGESNFTFDLLVLCHVLDLERETRYGGAQRLVLQVCKISWLCTGCRGQNMTTMADLGVATFQVALTHASFRIFLRNLGCE